MVRYALPLCLVFPQPVMGNVSLVTNSSALASFGNVPFTPPLICDNQKKSFLFLTGVSASPFLRCVPHFPLVPVVGALVVQLTWDRP